MHSNAMTPVIERQRFLACLSDPSRFSLVTTLAAGSHCVTELASLVGLSQSCTTRHLQALVREGIVSGKRQGKRVMFSLCASGEELHPVLRWACGSDAAARIEPGAAVGGGVRRTRQRQSARAATAGAVEDGGLKPGSRVEHEGGWVHADREANGRETVSMAADSDDDSISTESPGRVVRSEMDDFLL